MISGVVRGTLKGLSITAARELRMTDSSDTTYRSDVAFSPSVKRAQEQRGSRDGYQKRIEKRDWPDTISADLAGFIAERDSFYIATASADGQPYIQHRGGPKGFLRVVDDKTLGFADYAGNKQYISLGNFAENDKAHIFLMDYTNQRRIKIWGRARIVEGDADLLARLMPQGYGARPERAVLFTVTAWDVNCPQHIPQKFDIDIVEQATDKLTRRIALLEAELAKLKSQAGAE